MDGGAVERIPAIHNPQEAGGLLKALGAHAGHFHELPAGLEGPVLVTEGDDIAGQGRVEAGDMGEQGAEAVLTSTPTAFTQSSTTVSRSGPGRFGRHHAGTGPPRWPWDRS